MEQTARYAPWVVAVLAIVFVLGAARPSAAVRDAKSNDPHDQMNLRAFGNLPFIGERAISLPAVLRIQNS